MFVDVILSFVFGCLAAVIVIVVCELIERRLK